MHLLVSIVLASANANATQSLQQAQRLFDALDYDEVIPIAERVLEGQDATPTQRLEAYKLLGSCLAIVGRLVEAEQPFRLLLRAQPDYELPKKTPPKILAVFRKVQADERTIATEIAAVEHEQLLASMALEGETDGGTGGAPVRFEYRLKDPRGAARGVNVHYRRGVGGAFSALALARDAGGIWTGQIPGEWTANETGFSLQYFVRTYSEDSDLLTLGNDDEPISVWIEPGEVSGTPLYESFWFWGVLVAVAAAGAVTAGVLTTQLADDSPTTDLGEVRIPR